MASPKKEQSKDAQEIFPDAWERFERAVDAAVKSGPKHRKNTSVLNNAPAAILKTKERPASKGRVHKGKIKT